MHAWHVCKLRQASQDLLYIIKLTFKTSSTTKHMLQAGKAAKLDKLVISKAVLAYPVIKHRHEMSSTESEQASSSVARFVTWLCCHTCPPERSCSVLKGGCRHSRRIQTAICSDRHSPISPGLGSLLDDLKAVSDTLTAACKRRLHTKVLKLRENMESSHAESPARHTQRPPCKRPKADRL